MAVTRLDLITWRFTSDAELLGVLPEIGAPIAQPKFSTTRIGRNVLFDGRVVDFAFYHDDLFAVVGVTNGALVVAALDAIICLGLTHFAGLETQVFELPEVNGGDLDTEAVGQIGAHGTITTD